MPVSKTKIFLYIIRRLQNTETDQRTGNLKKYIFKPEIRTRHDMTLQTHIVTARTY